MPVNDFLNQPQYWQNQYEKIYGLPTAGRNPYEDWLARQWQTPASEYALQSAGVGSPRPGGLGADTSFESFLNAQRATPGYSPARMGGSYLDTLGLMAPAQQNALLEMLPNYVQGEALYGGLRNQYPAFIAQGRLAQEASPEAQRRFAISPAATQVGGDTFLNYLLNRFNMTPIRQNTTLPWTG